ncbi:hypothetical protein ARMGADRAFT_1120566 [Armillaria gallica]|uniref:Uncharacterized protein n=1 Tax=Armillaria gallica TaxID=47427 RepID=A0A2H3CYS9_ARMGA|nr:hypothetical protein ARMGADRAFT_1120566 [Armillaria gallica]
MSSDSTVTSTHQAKHPAFIDLLPDELLLEIFAIGTLDIDGTYFPFLIAAVCSYWCSLAVNEARLWTSLTVMTSMDVPVLPSDGSCDPLAIFPREALILERSADRDLDFEIPPFCQRSESFTDGHFAVLSSLLAEHAHRIRSFEVITDNWEEIGCLCKELAVMDMPRLQKWNVISERDLVYEETYDDKGQRIESVPALAYALDSESEPTPIQELKRPAILLYPALTDVAICGVPVAWCQFSASNLRKLVLTNHPWENQLMMQTLHGILSNSKDTLVTLTLRWVIAAETEWADSRLLLNRVILSRVEDLDIGYMHTQEACQVFEIFDFPALHELKLQGLDEEMDSSGVFLDMMKYLPVEQLDDLSLISIQFPPGDFPDKDLVRGGSIAEKSLPLILQFIRRLALLRNLLISPCGDAFLKYMNYGKAGSVNMAGLKELWVREYTQDLDIGIVPFLRERVELGTVDGEYVGPTIEDMTIVTDFRVGDEAKKYLKLADHTTWFSD